jgi:YD repeat-containing protein
MKQLIPILLLTLVPLILMGSMLSSNLFQFQTLLPANYTQDRSWRLNNVIQENYISADWSLTNEYQYVYSTIYPARLDTLKMLSWDNQGQDWVLFAKMVYQYDSTQEYITQAEVLSQQGGSWNSQYRNTFTYDAQNRLNFGLYEFYDFDASIWLTSGWTKIDIVSPTNFTAWQYGAQTQSSPQQWIRMNFTWDTQGRIIGETDLVSSDSLNWVNYEHYSRTYHPHDTTTSEIFIYNLSHNLPAQSMLSEDASNYNMFGMLSEEINTGWNGTGWDNLFRGNYTYNLQDLLTLFNEEQWVSGVWGDNMQTAYAYDANQNLSQVIKSFNQSGTMTPDVRYTVNWSQTTANQDDSAPSVSGLDMNSSPNPFTGKVSFTFKSKTAQPVDIKIYNLRGQIVRTLSSETNASVDWDGTDKLGNTVTQGFYFIRATSDALTTTSKVLKLQ